MPDTTCPSEKTQSAAGDFFFYFSYVFYHSLQQDRAIRKPIQALPNRPRDFGKNAERARKVEFMLALLYRNLRKNIEKQKLQFPDAKCLFLT